MRIRRIRVAAVVAASVALAVTVAVLRGGSTHVAQAQPAPSAPEMPVAEVLVRPVAEAAEHRGFLAATHVVDVRPRVAGYVQRVAFTDGALVVPGQLLLQLDARPLHMERQRLVAELEQSRAKLAHAEIERRRTETLVARGALSPRELDAQVAEERALRARTDAAAAALGAAELDVSFTRVTAPIRGRISRALITEGNLVGTGASAAPIATITAIDPIHVVFDVDEATYLSLAPRLQSDADARPRVRVGLVDDDGLPREATIDYVDTRAETTTGTVRVRASMPNRDGRLEPGLFARVSLVRSEPRPTVLVDDAAIRTEQDKRYVLVVGKDDRLAYRPVELGPVTGGLRVIRSGLEPGDVVVLKGMARAGMTIRPNKLVMGGAP